MEAMFAFYGVAADAVPLSIRRLFMLSAAVLAAMPAGEDRNQLTSAMWSVFAIVYVDNTLTLHAAYNMAYAAVAGSAPNAPAAAPAA